MRVLLVLLVLPSVQAALTLTSRFDDVNASTSLTTLTCNTDGFGKLTTVLGLIIEKKTGDDWEVVVQSYTGQTQPNVVFANATASGLIATSTRKPSKLHVVIPRDVSAGRYRCTALGYCSGRFLTEQAHTEMTSDGFSYAAITDIEDRLNRLENALAQGSGRDHPVTWDTSALAAMDGEDLFKLLVWPAGRYSLVMPETGCPHQGFSNVPWADAGFRQFHTESTAPENLDEVSPGSHLKTPIQAQNVNKHFIYLYFCSDASTAEKGPEWPRGSYCISKHTSCPEGFHEGSIQWDEEDTAHENKYAESLPSGTYNANTKIYFCCRRDGAHDEPMILPISKPFYLYRFDGQCQEVVGASVTNEYLVFDTENTGNNGDSYSDDYHPDGKLDNVRLELCYYEKVA